MLSASSYDNFTAAKEFRSQCLILLVLMEGAFNDAFNGTFKGKFGRHASLVNLRGESGAHEAPYVGPFDMEHPEGPGGITRGGHYSGAFRS